MDTRTSIERSFSQASAGYDNHASIQRRIGIDLLRRLHDAKASVGDSLQPDMSNHVILDAGCGTGQFLPALLALSGTANVPMCIALDRSPGMLTTMQARHPSAAVVPLRSDLESLPLVTNSVDLVFSNLAMQWLDDPSDWLVEAARVLKPGGWLAATTLTAGTLEQISHAWAAVDHARHVNGFWPVEALEPCVTRALAGGQVLTGRFTEYFTSPLAAMKSVKGVGAHTITAGGRTQLTSPGQLKKALAAYETLRTPEGVPLSYSAAFIFYRKST